MPRPPRPGAPPLPWEDWPGSLAVDPHDPIHQAFVRQELLRGTIRTIPDGTRRLRILPLPPRDHSDPRIP